MASCVLTRQQLLLHLGGERSFRAALRSGGWVRVLQGAYAELPADGALDLAVRASAAALVLPPGAVVAGHSALWLCGVDVLPAGPPVLEVLVARDRVPPRRPGISGRQGHLPAGDVGSIRGVPSLRPARATVDLLRRLRLQDAVAVADAVQRAGLCPQPLIAAELAAHARLRGVRSARQALALSDPLAESPQESRLRVTLVLDGLRPVPQYDVLDAVGTWLARVDLAFPEQRVAVEYDGREAHAARAFVRDRQRQNDLVLAGWVVLRFTAADLVRPREIVARVRAALARG